MAQLKKNLFLQGASGMLGSQLVYRTVNGETIVSTKPVKRSESSEAQKKQNKRFKYGAIYAKAAIEDESLGPIYTEAYERLKQFRSPYQLALTDYLRSPEIGDLNFVSGAAGSKVLVEAFEDPQVANVHVSILDAAEAVLDGGNATLINNGIQWEFELPVDIPEGGKLEVRAYDLPGNVTTKLFEIS